MTVTIISSVYGNYDTPEYVPQTVDVDWVLVTDGQTDVDPAWRQIIEPRPHMHPRLAAKVAKCRPDLYTESDVTIWVDASIVVRPRFAQWILDELGDHPIAQIPHPQRTSIVDEAEVSAGMVKYQGQPVREQAAHYTRQGHQPSWGLWATGLIARHRTSPLQTLGDRWLTEQLRWTYQDQLSQPYVLHWSGIRPHDLTGGLWHHPHFTVRSHRLDT
jgi:hypothetical protein